MSKKGDKSKGGNSFLTIKEGESEKSKKHEEYSSDEDDENSEHKIKNLVKKQSEEEKIEEFSKNVGDFLERIEVLRLLLFTFFTERFPELVEKIKIQIVRGKLKALRPLLPMLIVFQKINEKWFNKYNKKLAEKNEDDSEKDKAKESKEPKKPFTFLELAEKNIIFTDNKKRPLYSLDQMKDKSGYTASESVLAPIILENIVNAFIEVAPKAKSIPTPEIGKYAGVPMTQVMGYITEEDIIEFLEYVRNYPRGYVGKNYRITESFAGWAVSGTPED